MRVDFARCNRCAQSEKPKKGYWWLVMPSGTEHAFQDLGGGELSGISECGRWHPTEAGWPKAMSDAWLGGFEFGRRQMLEDARAAIGKPNLADPRSPAECWEDILTTLRANQ